MIRRQALWAIALSFLLPGCGREPAAVPKDFFPESNEVLGWSKVGETRTFAAASLWQYIDGDAEKYIQAGVQKTLTASYRYKDSTEATVDIHVMAAADGPRKIMDAESAAESQPVALGDAGRRYGASLIFRSAQYLVRVVAYKSSPEVGKALVELGRGIEKNLRHEAAKHG
jgi:hypothetical protein